MDKPKPKRLMPEEIDYDLGDESPECPESEEHRHKEDK